jgi:zinc protease
MKFVAFVASLVIGLAARAQDVPQIPFEKYKLANGLEVILIEDHRLPLVAVNMWYHVGALNEEPGRTGFAHLFEHLMFAGSKHVPRGMADQLTEAAGATDSNGSTDFDRTNYFDTWPAAELELGLWIQADRMGYLLDVVNQTALANQQDVVRNERRQRIENAPYGIVEEALYHNLFPKAHPYYASVMGSHADIQAARLDDVKRFFKSYYSPNNASLVIAGDIDKPKTKQLVARYFGSLKRGPDVPAVNVVTPPVTAERRLVVEDRIELQRVYMGWLTSPAYKAGDAELDVVATILGGGKSSRLYKKLVYELQIAQDVSASQGSQQVASIFQITVTARPGRTAKEIETAIDAELEKFRREGPDAKELSRAVNTIETALIQGVEKLGGFGLADRINRYNHYVGDPGFLGRDIERYRSLNAEAVRKAAAEQLRNESRVVIHAVPGKQDLGPEVPTPPATQARAGEATEAVNADEDWRKRRPRAGKLGKLTLPVPHSFKLANGLTVIHHERSGLPVVAANLVIKSGTEANPLGKPGLASFTADMLDEGTATRTSTQLADDIAQLGTTIETSSNADASFVAVASLKKNFAAALEILADVALHPSLPPEEIERTKASRLASLVQVRENPNALVERITAAALYGERHPFGYLAIGTEDAVRSTSREDLQQFWKQHYVPANAALIVSGAIGADELKALAEKYFGAWQPSPQPALVAAQPASTRARLVIVDKPDAPQTATRVARLGPSRLTPDYPQISVMNAALGGLFSSRISNNLREDKGYTYGANSGFQMRRNTGAFAVRTSLRTDVTAPGVQEIFKEIKGMREKPVGAEEAARARDSQVRSLPGEFETSASTVASFRDLFVYNLGLDYFGKLPARLGAVTPAAMQAAAKKYIPPESLVVVTVGDRAKIESGLGKLNLGAVEYRDADARVVK